MASSHICGRRVCTSNSPRQQHCQTMLKISTAQRSSANNAAAQEGAAKCNPSISCQGYGWLTLKGRTTLPGKCRISNANMDWQDRFLWRAVGTTCAPLPPPPRSHRAASEQKVFAKTEAYGLQSIMDSIAGKCKQKILSLLKKITYL